MSHTKLINNNDDCPEDFPFRVPQISYLIYWPYGENRDGVGVENWVLSSDKVGGTPGGSLHGDWLGGWNDDAINIWTDGCFDPGGNNPLNCSPGIVGPTGNGRRLRWFNASAQFEGPYTRPLPEE